ncbi:hypothetical protein [Acetobacter fallax]|uniref:Uncharacterized protein n=1 Tax=Acetobacter fallax TaxID=1737473 RepID=A0ABX0K9V9_9PROT|nr:hypothetical protein [Acetobacter fallax]NHO33202.1 hypothetical protein [Acetobacter fallax]NHO36776.1 hypothetical protein [Acetobacter fallax]
MRLRDIRTPGPAAFLFVEGMFWHRHPVGTAIAGVITVMLLFLGEALNEDDTYLRGVKDGQSRIVSDPDDTGSGKGGAGTGGW